MAFTMDVKKSEAGFVGEIVAENTYVKVAAISGNKENLQISLIGICNDIAIFQRAYSFAPKLSGDNFIAQAYAYLKTLEEYEGAVDC